ncbi:unnamed protein product [Effrenium voratum]|nr:unnamed protein product [Effrenium voratum]
MTLFRFAVTGQSLLLLVQQAWCSAAPARVVDSSGAASHAGLLELQTSGGGYGSVCGMNSAAAHVACRQLGFDFGVVSSTPCGQYGGQSHCGASGSAVAMKNLKCGGSEMSLSECEFEDADEACFSHSSDAIVYCGLDNAVPFVNGELRLVDGDGAPALPQEAGRLEMYLAAKSAWAPVCKVGFTSGAAAVACKQMQFSGSSGFSGCQSAGLCGRVAPEVAELACSGQEGSVVQCPLATGDDVFCAPEESVVLSCAGGGNPIGPPAAPANEPMM